MTDPLIAEHRAGRTILRASSRVACWAWLRVLRTGEVPHDDHEVQVFAALELADAKGRRKDSTKREPPRRSVIPASRGFAFSPEAS